MKTEVPKGDNYEPALQVKKTLKNKTVYEPDEIIKNILPKK